MKNYPLNKVDQVSDLKELIKNCSKKYGDKIAFRYKQKNEDFQKTYNQFYNDVVFLGTSFLNMNIKGSQIAVIGENSYEWIVTYFAAATTGNVIVPIDKELSSQDIIKLIGEAECKVLVYSNHFQETAKEAVKVLNMPLTVISMKTDYENNDSAKLSIEELIKEGKNAILAGNLIFESIKIVKDQLAAIHYTSGTTGVSKGVMLTHKNITANVIGALNNVKVWDTSVIILPTNHTFGLIAGILCMLHDGRCICINNSMKRISSDLKYYKPDQLFLVPLYVEALYKKIWKTAKSKNKEKQLRIACRLSDALLFLKIDLRKYIFKNVIDGFGGKLKLIVCGGAPLDPKYVKGFRTFGINVLNGYGITECSPIVAVNRNEYFRDGSVGTVLPCCSIMIHDPDEDAEGEILVKGDSVMKGYYKNDKETEKVFLDGWFKTGDIGKMDSNGFLYITGRTKNIIIFSNGKNIYPEELEMAISNIPFVKETLVYSEKNEKDNEISLTAEVYLNEDYIEGKIQQDIEKEISDKIHQINKVLPVYKNISKFIIKKTEFQKTTTKKIIRNVRY